MNEKGEEELMHIENIVQKELLTTTSEAPVSTNGVCEAPVMTNGVPGQQKEASGSLLLPVLAPLNQSKSVLFVQLQLKLVKLQL